MRAWLERYSLPTRHRSPFQQAAYLRGFLRSVGDGLDQVQTGATLAQAKQVATAELATPLPEVLARMDAVIKADRLPCAEVLPTVRPVAEIGYESEAPSGAAGDGTRTRTRAALARAAELP